MFVFFLESDDKLKHKNSVLYFCILLSYNSHSCPAKLQSSLNSWIAAHWGLSTLSFKLKKYGKKSP